MNFLAEISYKSDKIIHPTPSNNYDKQYNIYEIDINKIENETYWTDWGGTYDHYTGTQIELYYGLFLQKANSVNEVLTTANSLFITNENIVLINIPKHPWIYPDYSTEIEEVVPFLSSCLNPDNPSNNILREINAPVKLELPNFTVKLSDNIAGITLNQGFNIDLINNDGYFDNEIKWNLLNTPLHLKKSCIENPTYSDFHTIRTGLIENVSTTFNNVNISISDKIKAMNEPVCNVIKQSDYLNIIIEEKSIGKNIPVLYGTKKIKLIKLNLNNYLACEYISNISGVYNKDGNSISFSQNNDIILTNEEADYAIVTGYVNNKIGEIILDLINKKTKIMYNDSNWNIEELESYIEKSPKVNIVFENGDVKKCIQDTLKSDLAFFIQTIDGRFTIRYYGNTYNTHTIPNWCITKKPEKTWESAQENYFSSCIVNYNYIDNELYSTYAYTEKENEAENLYRKIVRKTFDTNLINESDVIKLAKLLTERYTYLKQTLKLYVGIDTSNYELLDTVRININVNERNFNCSNLYYIKEINPAQDILTLEEININDITGEYPNTNYYENDYDNEYVDSNDYEYIIDGGFI